MAQTVKNPPEMQEIQVQSLGWEDPLEKGMATHSSILAWRILVGYSLCGHDWTTNTRVHVHTRTHAHTRTYSFCLTAFASFQSWKFQIKCHVFKKAWSPALHSQCSFSFSLIALSQFLVLYVLAFDWLYPPFDSVLFEKSKPCAHPAPLNPSLTQLNSC